MLVKFQEEIRLPWWGWLDTRLAGPNPRTGRVLIEIRGLSGQSSWTCALLTAPQSAIRGEKGKFYLQPGVYRLEEGQDRRGQRLIRLYPAEGEDTNLLAFGVDGFVVPEASDPGVMEIIRAQGRSRSGQNGDRWALIVGPVGALVAVQPYERPDPKYFLVTPMGLTPLGETDAVLAPDEW
jgi:hypothetical protein